MERLTILFYMNMAAECNKVYGGSQPASLQN